MTNPRHNLRILNVLTFLYTFRTFEGVWVIYFAMITGSYATAMGLFALMHVVSSSMEVPTGLLSDRIGRKYTIILYCLFGCSSTLLFYLAESTVVLIAGSVVVGLSMALGSGTITAFVYENVQALGEESLYKKYEGFRRALTKYSLAVAGVLGTAIIYFYDIRTALLVSLVAALGSFVCALLLENVRRTNERSGNIYQDMTAAFVAFKQNASLRDFSLGRMFGRGVGNAEYRFRSLFLSTLMPEWLVNLVILCAGVLVGIFMQLNYLVVGKLGFKTALVRLEIVNRFIVTVCAFISTAVSGTVMTFTNSISHGISDVASEDLLQQRYSNNERATMGSLVSLGGSIIYIITAAGSGLVADHIGLLNTMLLLQPFLLIAVYLYWRGLRHSS